MQCISLSGAAANSVEACLDVSMLGGDTVSMTKGTKVYRIRMADSEVEVADIEAVVALARAGRIGRVTKVCLPEQTDWVQADSIPEVEKVLGGDPWSAWDAEAPSDMLADYAPPPLRQALTDPPPPKRDDGVDDLPASAMRPMEIAPLREESTAVPLSPVRRPSGKVIAFPDGGLTDTRGPHALDRALRHLDSRPETEPSGPSISWLRLAGVAIVCVVTMLLWVWHVNSTATSELPRRSKQVARTLPERTAAPMRAKAPPASPYEEVEDELRDQLMEGILDIPSDEGFEDALLIELRRVRLDVAWVGVRIESWAGRNQELPQAVAIQVRMRGKDAELDRDLAAVGLVMGKYIQHYGLETTQLVVMIEDEAGGVRQVEMDSQVARRFFTHRLSLERFLSAAFRGGK